MTGRTWLDCPSNTRCVETLHPYHCQTPQQRSWCSCVWHLWHHGQRGKAGSYIEPKKGSNGLGAHWYTCDNLLPPPCRWLWLPLWLYFMVPCSGDTPRPMDVSNLTHMQACMVVEITFGMLKIHFWYVPLSGRYLLRTQEKAAKVVVACNILHNMDLQRNIHFLAQGPWKSGLMRRS